MVKDEEQRRGSPFSLTERDQMFRKFTQEQNERMQREVKFKAKQEARQQSQAFASECATIAPERDLKIDEPVVIVGLTGEREKLNGKKAIVSKYENNGQVMVELARGISSYHTV